MIRLTFTGGIARRTAADKYGNSFVEWTRDVFAMETDATCADCGVTTGDGWVNLDGGEVYCPECVTVVDDDGSCADGDHDFTDDRDPSCGVRICRDCGHHDGIVRCFCGWSADGGDGRAQLRRMGERF